MVVPWNDLPLETQNTRQLVPAGQEPLGVQMLVVIVPKYKGGIKGEIWMQVGWLATGLAFGKKKKT